MGSFLWSIVMSGNAVYFDVESLDGAATYRYDRKSGKLFEIREYKNRKIRKIRGIQ